MKQFSAILVALLSAWSVSPFAASSDTLEDNRDNVSGRVKPVYSEAALRALVEKADRALQTSPLSVTQKAQPAASGNVHDYASTAPYFWPNPASSNGLPFIRHDGRVNPESRTAASDYERAQSMSRTVATLARAYEAEGQEKYAAQAARCLRVWFLDPVTYMTPNLNHAQSVPGLNDGRQIGIIEGYSLISALGTARLLEGSAAWTAADQAALMQWATAFLDWLTTSPFGVKERDAGNNHGTHYDVQVMRLALMLGRNDLARQVAETAKAKRIAAQIEPDGRQPQELARTAAFSYSRMNLSGLMNLAQLADQVGVDLWHYETPDGRSIRRALDFLLPYVMDPAKKWPYEQIKGFHRDSFASLLRQAAVAYDEPSYGQLAAQLAAKPEAAESSEPTPPGK